MAPDRSILLFGLATFRSDCISLFQAYPSPQHAPCRRRTLEGHPGQHPGHTWSRRSASHWSPEGAGLPRSHPRGVAEPGDQWDACAGGQAPGLASRYPQLSFPAPAPPPPVADPSGSRGSPRNNCVLREGE